MSVHGTVLTVSNNPSAPAQYNTVSAAIAAANVGDTLYLLGSNTSYGDFTIPKRLTVIGAGYDVVGTDYNLSTQVGYVTLDSTLSGPIDGVTLLGLSMYGISSASGDLGYIDNVTVKRCRIGGYVYVSGSNWSIVNNIINNVTIYIGNFTNLFVANNVFYQGSFYNSNQASVYIINNLFLYYNSSYLFQTVSNANIYNNIFYANSVTVYNSVNNVFNNNLSYNTSNYTLPPAGNSGTGNIQQTDPQFVSQSSIPAPVLVLLLLII
ncbi:MAG: hypothetical protein ACP5PS_00250 [Bacteroidales bacterium]